MAEEQTVKVRLDEDWIWARTTIQDKVDAEGAIVRDKKGRPVRDAVPGTSKRHRKGEVVEVPRSVYESMTKEHPKFRRPFVRCTLIEPAS